MYITQEAKPIRVYGINNFYFECKHCFNLTLMSQANNVYSQQVNCIVTQRITGNLPTQLVDVKALNPPSDLKLADPGFNMPCEVDLLRGSDVFFWILLKIIKWH